MLASGSKVLLRDRVSSDVERWIYWQTHGEWRTSEPPWYGLARDSLAPEYGGGGPPRTLQGSGESKVHQDFSSSRTRAVHERRRCARAREDERVRGAFHT